jgi:small subunit ribosomal protein S16
VCFLLEILVALKIRLARGGAKKRPFYRMIVADSRNPRDGSFLERLGTYDPFLPKEDPARIVVNGERVKYWFSVGAKASDRVALLLSVCGLCEKPAICLTPQKSASKKKAQERLKAQQEAAAAS